MPGTVLIPPLRTQVALGQTLLASEPGVLEWTGTMVRLVRESGEVLLEVPPGALRKVRIDQGAAITLRAGAETYHATFPEAAAVLVRNIGAVFPGPVLDRTHAMMATTPANSWIQTFRGLGVPVRDNSFAPSRSQVLRVSLWIFVACIASAILVALARSLAQ
jgi:hypothetical protein